MLMGNLRLGKYMWCKLPAPPSAPPFLPKHTNTHHHQASRACEGETSLLIQPTNSKQFTMCSSQIAQSSKDTGTAVPLFATNLVFFSFFSFTIKNKLASSGMFLN